MTTCCIATRPAHRCRPSTTSTRRTRLPSASKQGARALEAVASALTDSGVADPHSRETAARSASSFTTSRPCTRWRFSWRRCWPVGKPITGVTWDVVHDINAKHARENAAVTKEAALDLLRRNSAAAAAAIRALSDEELDRAATVSLNADAPLTCQFFLEDHAVRHSYHHLARIRAALAVVWSPRRGHRP